MNRARSSLPDRIPPSYYARPAGAAPGPAGPTPPTPQRAPLRLLGSLVLTSLALASGAWGARRRVPLLRSANPAHLAAGCALAGCLLVGLVLGVRGAGSAQPAGGHPAGRAALAAGPTASPKVASPSPPPPTSPPSPTSAPSPTPSPTPRRTPTPAPPIAFLDAPLSSSGRQSVTLLVRTAPGSTCSIAVGYQPPPALDPATADGAGTVAWTWTVPRHAPSGTWPIAVTCGSSTATTQIVLP